MPYFKVPALAKFAVLAAAFALQGVATAAPSVAPASTTQNAAPTNVSMWVPGFGPVNKKTVSSLKLNASQTKLVADAQAAQDQFQKSLLDLKRTSRQEQKAQLRAGKIDPHAAQNAADDMWKKGMGASRDQVTKKWLAVWDALDSTQQQKVTAYLKQKADNPAKSTGDWGREP